MIRNFSLVVLNQQDMIIDRINLDLIDQPKGLGFSLESAVIETDVEDILVSFRQKHENVTLNVNYAFGNEYLKAKALRQWIEKNTGKVMALQWYTITDKLYAGCIVNKFDFSEINNDRILSVPLTIKLLTPFFDVIENEIYILPSTTGKIYAFIYPFIYGEGLSSNNIITNTYIKPIPLNITLYGEMATPAVGIKFKDAMTNYADIVFEGLSLSKNMWININSISRKITLFNGYEEIDGYDYIDATKQSFIFARTGISELNANVQSDKTGRLRASYRRYRL